MGSFKKNPTRYLWYLILIPLPVVLLFVSQWEMDIRGPYFERRNLDPEYAYLFNGLALSNGQSPTHFHHPGTTLQTLTAVVINVRHTIKNFAVVSTPKTEDVLLHPEEYLRAVRDFMATVIAILYFLVAAQIYNKTKLIWAAIGFQLFPFLSGSVIHSLVRVSAEPLLVIVTLLATIFLVDATEKKQPVYSIWLPIFMGFILGAGLVTKLTFLPFLLLVLWFPRLRDRILVVSTCIGAFLLLTIPVWSRAGDIITWVTKLITKQGAYGSRADGLFPPFQKLIANLIYLIQSEPFYFAILVILILWCILSWRNRTPENQPERLRVSLSIGILIIQLGMVMKFPRTYYMIPGLAWLGFIFLMGIFKLQSIFSIESTNYKIFRATLLILLIGLAGMNTFAFQGLIQSTHGKEHANTQTINAFIKKNYPDCSVIPFHGGSDPRFALFFGDDWAGGAFTKKLTELYPHTILYNIHTRSFTSFVKQANQESEIKNRLSRGECILLRGRLRTRLDKKLVLEKVIIKPSEKVYRLKAILSKTP